MSFDEDGEKGDVLEALSQLEDSMNRLKLDLPGGSDLVRSGSDDELEPPPNIDGYGDIVDAMVEQGPIPEDAEMDEEEAALLLDVDGRTAGAKFHTTLSENLMQLLAKAKATGSPSIKTILELTVVSDYNILRENLRKAGCRSPSTSASLEIARVKAFDPLKGAPIKTRQENLARSIRTKANYIVRFGCLPGSKQGKGATHHSLLCNEDVRHGILTYLRAQQVGKVSGFSMSCEHSANHVTYKSPDHSKSSASGSKPEYPPSAGHFHADQPIDS